MASAAAHALCLNHPTREAAARCTACKQSFCRECVTLYDGRMLCSACYRAKLEAKPKKARDWYVLTIACQALLGIGILWLSAWCLGRALVRIPAEFHEGTVWKRIGQ